MGKKILKYTLRVLAALFGLVLLLLIFVYLPPVQNLIKRKAVEYVNNTMDMTLSVEKLRLRFPLNLTITNATALTPEQDTLFHAGKFHGKVALFPLLRKRVVVRTLEVEDATMHYVDTMAAMDLRVQVERLGLRVKLADLSTQEVNIPWIELTGGTVGLDLGEARPDTTTTSSAPMLWKIAADKLQLERIDFHMRTGPDTTDLKALLAEGLIRNCSVDLGGQEVDAEAVTLTRGDYAYLADTIPVPPIQPVPVTVADSMAAADSSYWTVRVAHVQLVDNAARYGLPYGTPIERGVDPNHLALNDLNLSIDSAFYQGTAINALLKELAFKERSGLEVTSASGRLAMDSIGYRVNNFELNTTASNIKLEASVGAGISKMLPSTPMEVDLTAGLATADLFLLYPMDLSLEHKLAGRELSVRTQASGVLDDLNLEDVEVALPQVLNLTANGEVTSLSNPDQIAGRLQFNGAITGPDAVSAFLPDSLGITLIPMQLRGAAVASAGTYRGDVHLAAGGGKADIKGSFNPNSERYQANVSVDDFPLYRILQTDSLGYVTLDLAAEGRGFDFYAPSTQAKVDLKVDSLDYMDFRYHDVRLQAALANNRVHGNLDSRNAALNVRLAIDGLLTEARQQVKVGGVVHAIDLEQMHFASEPAAFSFKWDLEAAASGSGPAAVYDVNTTLDSVRVKYGDFANDVRRTTLQAHASPGLTRADMHSGDLSLAFRTPMSLDSLMAGIGRTASALGDQIASGNIDTDSLEYILPPFQLDVDAGRNNIVNNYMRTQGLGFGQLTVKASSATNTKFALRGEMDQFSTSGITLDTLTFGVQHRNEQIGYYLRMANRPKNLSQLGLVYLWGGLEENHASIQLLQRNRERRTGVNFGLKATLADSLVTVVVNPEEPILGYARWTVNPDNYIHYNYYNSELQANLELTTPGKEVSLQSYVDLDMPKGSVHLLMQGLEIGKILELMLNPPPVDGILDTDLTFGIAGRHMAGRGYVGVDSLFYDQKRVGDLRADVTYKGDTVTPQQGTLKLTIDRQTALTVEGSYAAVDSNAFRLTADVPGLQLAVANAFMPENTAALEGVLKGHIDAQGQGNELLVDGQLNFDQTAVDVEVIGTSFGLSSNPITIDNSQARFADFAITGPNRKPLTINGTVDFSNLSHILTDLTAEASDFEFINVPYERNAMVFGQGSADISVRAQGALESLNLRGKIDLLGGTDITYVMQDSPMDVENQSQDVVEFVSFADTMNIYPPRRPSMFGTGGLDILVDLGIDRDVDLSIYLSTDGTNRIELQGEGNLTYAMNRQGDGRFSGRYNLTGGTVRYSPPVISAKNFAIQDGGYVLWDGEMMNPQFDILAIEKVNTTVTTEGQTGGRQVTFDISLSVKGTLGNLGLIFDLAAPQDLVVQNELASLTPEERGNQAMSLLLYNTYTGPNSTAKANQINPINSFIAKELNQWAQNNLQGVDLSFGVDSYENTAGDNTTNYSYSLSKRFFDNRVRAVIGGKYSTDADATDNLKENLVDDITLEYYFSNRDNMFLKVYRHSNFESILEGEVTETGVGFVVQKKMYRMRDLFKLTPEKKERKAIRKAMRQEKRKAPDPVETKNHDSIRTEEEQALPPEISPNP